MPLFEVFIPSVDVGGFNITARITADSWIQALRMGLSKLGDTTDVQNIMCDFTETGIDVTEPNSGRVFRIKELDGAQPDPAATAPTAIPAAPVLPTAQPAAPATQQAAPAPIPTAVPTSVPAAPVPATPQPVVQAAPPPAAAPVAAPPPAAPLPVNPPPAAPPAAVIQPATPVAPPAVAQPAAQPTAPAPAPQVAPPTVAEQPVTPPPAQAPKAVPIARVQTKVAGTQIPGADRFKVQEAIEIVSEEAAQPGQLQSIGRGKEEKDENFEEKLAIVFEKAQDVYLEATDLNSASEYLLDLAMEYIPSDSGSVFISDISQHDLYFSAARGPKASEVMSFRVPMGIGIVGFSANDGVSLAISDVQRDPRFYRDISEKLGYETHSIACSPIQQNGRVFGAIELINRKGGPKFTNSEIDILNYVCHEMANYMVNTGISTI